MRALGWVGRAAVLIQPGRAGGFERFWNENFDRLDEYVQDLGRRGRRSSS
ncbi:hypothetical protein [Parafrankia discariae]|nr:hypothetical protein [Parafrankia discariae]